MSTTRRSLNILNVDVDVVYKDIKHLHIAVYPPAGQVRVSAPERLGDEQVRLAVIQRLPWIRRERERFQSAERQSPRQMAIGESHYVWGVRLRLRVVERPGRANVEPDGERLVLYVPSSTTAEDRLALLRRWQRQQLRLRVPALLEKWEPLVGRRVVRWGIRRMKTKWGSCNRDAGSVWFNLELATKHPNCLEYVVVHELAHLVERGHGARFTTLMDSLLPDWRIRRDQLNAAPLADEAWSHGE